MSDQIDEAQALDARLTEAAVAAARQHKQVEAPAGFKGDSCIDCDAPLGLIRRHAGRLRCAECQTYHERENTIRRKTRGEE